MALRDEQAIYDARELEQAADYRHDEIMAATRRAHERRLGETEYEARIEHDAWQDAMSEIRTLESQRNRAEASANEYHRAGKELHEAHEREKREAAQYMKTSYRDPFVPST
jgi:hypothetical protein